MAERFQQMAETHMEKNIMKREIFANIAIALEFDANHPLQDVQNDVFTLAGIFGHTHVRHRFRFPNGEAPFLFLA